MVDLVNKSKSRLLLITASDAGSANVLVHALQSIRLPYVLLAQSPAWDIFYRNGILCKKIDRLDWDQLQHFGKSLFSRINPTAILTGTSWGLTLDKVALICAKEKNIKSASIIEHWDLYRERFSILSNGVITDPDIFLPQEIWVNDLIAYEDCIKSGLPIERLKIVGQPHLESMLQKLLNRGPLKKNRSILFVSERIGVDFPIGEKSYKGFDEFDVLKSLLDIAKETKWSINIKLHPQEEVEKYDEFLEGIKDIDVNILDHSNINEEIILSAGKIVGMHSMFLLEAALVRGDVISYTPGGNPINFIGNRLGATESINTADKLKITLSKYDALKSENKPQSTLFGKGFLGSILRIDNAIKALME